MEEIVVSQPDMLAALNASEIDMQIATAHKFPRNVEKSLARIKELAIQDPDTAADCFYVLHRKSADGEEVDIDGLSVRMAEIIAGSWGNLRVASRIIGNDGKTITAQAVCHDLETNFAISVEVKRRITTKKGFTFSEDMQVVTGNAASAIARRNAILTVVPKAVTAKVVAEIKEVAFGQALDVPKSRQMMITYYQKLGITTEQILHYLEVDCVDNIKKEHILRMRATTQAIKEGTTTLEETFIKPAAEAVAGERAVNKATTAKQKAALAAARQKGETPAEGKTAENNAGK